MRPKHFHRTITIGKGHREHRIQGPEHHHSQRDQQNTVKNITTARGRNQRRGEARGEGRDRSAVSSRKDRGHPRSPSMQHPGAAGGAEPRPYERRAAAQPHAWAQSPAGTARCRRAPHPAAPPAPPAAPVPSVPPCPVRGSHRPLLTVPPPRSPRSPRSHPGPAAASRIDPETTR